MEDKWYLGSNRVVAQRRASMRERGRQARAGGVRAAVRIVQRRSGRDHVRQGRSRLEMNKKNNINESKKENAKDGAKGVVAVVFELVHFMSFVSINQSSGSHGIASSKLANSW